MCELSSDRGQMAGEMSPSALLTRAEESFNSAFVYFNSRLNHSDLTVPYVFIEGYDQDYYRSRVDFASRSAAPTVYVKCGGKKNVIEMWRKLNGNHTYSTFRKLYFVDKDYDDNSGISSDIFVTCGYSVENYYCSESFIRKFLRDVCHLDETTEKVRYEGVMGDFKAWRTEFINSAKPFCAWYKAVKGKNVRVENKNYEKSLPECYCTINSNSISVSAYDYNKLNADYCISDPVTEEEYNAAYTSIICCNDIRGKFVLQFIEAYIKHLEDTAGKKSHLLKKRFNQKFPNRTILMTLLSSLADTPLRLRNYIHSRV